MKNRSGETYIQRLLGKIFGILGLAFIVAAVIVHVAVYGGFRFSPFMWETDVFIVSFTFLLIGITFFLLGMAFFRWACARRRRIKRLIEEGDRIKADIDDIVPNFSVRVNMQWPYKLRCSWHDTRGGVTYHFRSGNLWGNPARILEERGISTVNVYVERGNLRKYHVEVPGFGERDIYL